ncbi:MAG: aldehyde reductase [Rhodobacteraceae bacterium]|nr:aldehyde reductase [Paracoccaceae bacterium]
MPQKILLTGASGYIAKHTALQLLDAGFTLRASVRNTAKADELRAALAPHLADPAALEQRFETVLLDLNDEAGWAAAAQGMDAIMHMASPFPMAPPKNEDDLIRPAVDGTLRALQAAADAGVTRFILTSSSVAIMDAELPEGRSVYNESDWTDPTKPSLRAYEKSKTLAEMAAWDFVAKTAPQIAMTVINPTLVTGPPLDANFGTSVELIERLLSGRDPMLPRIGFPMVDVRDVALMHLRALERPETAGQRYIGVQSFHWMPELGVALKAVYPSRKIATRTAPSFLVRIMALWDPAIRSVLPVLGIRKEGSNAKASAELGIEFRDALDAMRATAAALIAFEQNKGKT